MLTQQAIRSARQRLCTCRNATEDNQDRRRRRRAGGRRRAK
jgi:hypothetical protein